MLPLEKPEIKFPKINLKETIKELYEKLKQQKQKIKK